jgi:hypothetical protein
MAQKRVLVRHPENFITGSAKVGGGALWIGIHVTLKTTRAISFTVTPVLTLLRAKCYDFRAAFDLPHPDEKRTVVVVIKRRLPLLLTC